MWVKLASIAELWLHDLKQNINSPWKTNLLGREPWSSGNGWWLMIERLWVRIPATGRMCHFFTLICCQNCIDVCLKRPKIYKKRPGLDHFFLKKESSLHLSNIGQYFTYFQSSVQFHNKMTNSNTKNCSVCLGPIVVTKAQTHGLGRSAPTFIVGCDTTCGQSYKAIYNRKLHL